MKTLIFAAVALALGPMAIASAQQTPPYVTPAPPAATPVTPPDPTPVTPPPTTPVTGTVEMIDALGNPVTVRSHLPQPPARDHRAAFDALDADSDGGVSRSEARVDKYLARAFAALDGDRDGRLDYREALAWLND